MARVRPFLDLLKIYGGLSREAFLERVRLPHLHFVDLPDIDPPNFQTIQFSATADSEQTPHGLPRPGVVPTSLDSQGIISLKKDEGLNAFSTMITVGRAPNNDVTIPDKRISKFHAYFRQAADGSWSFTDANSTNGTVVEGMRLSPGGCVAARSGATFLLSGVITVRFLEPAELYDLVQEHQHMLV